MSFFKSEASYWARDIIFIVTEHEQLGMEAWLEAYHSTSSGSNNAIHFGQLDARAGSIQVRLYRNQFYSIKVLSLQIFFSKGGHQFRVPA